MNYFFLPWWQRKCLLCRQNTDSATPAVSQVFLMNQFEEPCLIWLQEKNKAWFCVTGQSGPTPSNRAAWNTG